VFSRLYFSILTQTSGLDTEYSWERKSGSSNWSFCLGANWPGSEKVQYRNESERDCTCIGAVVRRLQFWRFCEGGWG